ncbi:helix-turn-helix domain-containing protein, partial [Streptomyces sp. NPDC059233]
LDAFGYGPRTVGRILRLRRALALARSGTAYAEIAHTTGYADQAHLAREVRAPAGTTLIAYAGSAGAKRETPQPSGSRTTA